MTQAAFAADRIRTFGERVERLDAEISSLNSDKKELYAEMKSEGLDVPAFKAAIRKKHAIEIDPIKADDLEWATDAYLCALQGKSLPDIKSVQPIAKPALVATPATANGLIDETAPTRVHVHEAVYDVGDIPAPLDRRAVKSKPDHTPDQLLGAQ